MRAVKEYQKIDASPSQNYCGSVPKSRANRSAGRQASTSGISPFINNSGAPMKMNYGTSGVGGTHKGLVKSAERPSDTHQGKLVADVGKAQPYVPIQAPAILSSDTK